VFAPVDGDNDELKACVDGGGMDHVPRLILNDIRVVPNPHLGLGLLVSAIGAHLPQLLESGAVVESYAAKGFIPALAGDALCESGRIHGVFILILVTTIGAGGYLATAVRNPLPLRE
jgi:hypothetical protein